MTVDKVKLLHDTVSGLEAQKNFPYSPERRMEWGMALDEAKQMLKIELKNRKGKK